MSPRAPVDTVDASLEEARRHFRAGRVKEALALANDLVRRAPEDPRAWALSSDLLWRAGDPRRSLTAVDRALALEPRNPAHRVQRGRILAALGDTKAAAAEADAALRLTPTSPALFDAIGAVYSAAERQSEALTLFEKAVGAVPDNPHFLFNLATARRFFGDVDGAERALDKVIAVNRNDCGAYHLRADLRRQTAESNHIAEMERVLKGDIADWRGRVQLLYALAKECEDVGDDERSFAYLKQGADLRRTNTRYDVQKDIAIIDAIVSRHTAPALAAMGEGCPSPEPIFIIGLPRTGTTLVERILARHSEVFAAGELRDFAAEMVRLVGASSGGKASSHKLVELSLRLDAGELGRAYIDATRPRTGNTPRFTDKLPLNYLYAGLIHAALPKAKIVHVTRAPMDTCYAIYKTLFARAYPFSYDLADLGQYYLAYRRLMDHWRDALPGVVVDLRYEDLVSQPDESSRRLVAACDLAWELACLDFHSSLEASTTASAVQVRRPIYTSSVGKWRRFERQLEPLRALLARHGVDVT